MFSWRRLFFSTCTIFLLAAPLFGDNLLQNRAFASNLDGWVGGSNATRAWSSFGHGGSTGSALVTSKIGNFGVNIPAADVDQCAAVVAGHSYAFGASLYVPASVAPGAHVSEFGSVQFFPGPSCTGGQLSSAIRFAAPPLREVWADVQGNETAPVGAVSAYLGFGAADYAGSAAAESIQVYVDDAYLLSDTRCAATESHLCLSAGRFRVNGTWSVPSEDRIGYMRAVPVTSDSGLFWFFSDTNLEVFVKVLNACVDPFQHYWVFAAGLTNVEVSLSVYDTVSGQVRDYFNSSGTAFPPIQDTSAFATCP